MLEALGASRRGARRVLRAAEPARASTRRSWPTPRASSASTDERVDVVDDVADAVERAIAETPADGQVVVTGSLYVVGAARAALRASAD